MWPCLAARLYHARAGLSPPSGTSPFRSIWAHRNWASGCPCPAAAESGARALQGGPLTEFEKLCDDVVGDYLAGALFVPFGEAPLVGYLAARETEYTNLRILLMGRGAVIAPDVIRSRLRASYV